MQPIAKKLISSVPITNKWENSQWSRLGVAASKPIGAYGEAWILEELKQKGYSVEKGRQNIKGEVGHDILLVEGSYKVEVKTALAVFNRGAQKLVLDSAHWQHLVLDSADVYIFIGINPENNYHVRKGWRDTLEESFILYFTREEMLNIEKEGLFSPQYKGLQTKAILLKELGYAYDYREFPY
jgi:hypothetical protein